MLEMIFRQIAHNMGSRNRKFVAFDFLWGHAMVSRIRFMTVVARWTGVPDISRRLSACSNSSSYSQTGSEKIWDRLAAYSFAIGFGGQSFVLSGPWLDFDMICNGIDCTGVCNYAIFNILG